MATTYIATRNLALFMIFQGKQMNSEPLVVTEQELENFIYAYINDSRLPKKDFLNNTYEYDFSDNCPIAEGIKYDANKKTYTATVSLTSICQNIAKTDKTNSLTYTLSAYAETLVKEKAYKKQKPDEPVC